MIEIFHLGLTGPTVGAIRLDETFGIIALVIGRGVYILLGLVPMALGASLGAAYARHLSGASAPTKTTAARLAKYASTALVVAVSAFLVLLAVMILLPPGTPAIAGADGKSVPGSIAEVTMVDINGHDQGLLIRGHSVDNPVLLYLAGGPGQSDLAIPAGAVHRAGRELYRSLLGSARGRQVVCRVRALFRTDIRQGCR